MSYMELYSMVGGEILETQLPRSPVKDPGMKEYLLEQFKHDWVEMAHIDRIFHGLLKLYFTLLSGLWLALSAIYAWKLGKNAVSQSTDFFTAMRIECIVVAGILLVIGIAVYLFHLFKRKGTVDARVDMMLIRTAFVQCSDNPDDAKKYLFFPLLPPLESMAPRETKEVKERIKYSRLSGMDASCMYICAFLNGIMLYALVTLHKVPAISLWFGNIATEGLVTGLFVIFQILLYLGILYRSDKRLREKLLKRVVENEQKPEECKSGFYAH